MVKFEGDLTDGPTVDTSRPGESIMDATKWMVGVGILFALLAAAQSTVTPVVQSGLSMVPGVSAGDGTEGVRVG